MQKISIEIVDIIDTSVVYDELSDAASGGICVFLGTVREFTNNETVVSLEFESYKMMALKEM
ncbi:MAG: molybdenum cofactor biosynthesis protein MoaE, partial [Maribacter sp.]|nr:molybdenum cofactor biosynthesis protein MoaE [Maribacter sp.]